MHKNWKFYRCFILQTTMDLQSTLKNMIKSDEGYSSDDSLSSISDDFKGLTTRGKKLVKVTNRLTEENFGGRKGVSALVKYGDIFADETEYEIMW